MKKVVLFSLFLILTNSIYAAANVYKILEMYAVPKHNGKVDEVGPQHQIQVSDDYIIIDEGKIKIGKIIYTISKMDQALIPDTTADFLSGKVIDNDGSRADLAIMYDPKLVQTTFMIEYNNILYWFVTEKKA